MSDLALTTSSATAPQTFHWIDLETASQLSGLSVGHLRRCAGREWMGEGRAKLIQEQGKKAEWKIRSDVHSSFTANLTPLVPAAAPAAGTDLREYPKALRDQALARKIILDRWEKTVAAGAALGMNREAATTRFEEMLAIEASQGKGEAVKRSRLYEWKRDFAAEGLPGLMDGRTKRTINAQPEAKDPFLMEIWDKLYLDRRQLKVQLCYEIALLTAHDRGWKVCSSRSARRFVERMCKEHPGIVQFRRYGEEAFTNTIEPFIARDYSTITSNEIWCADHHQFDVMVQVGTRTNTNTGEQVPILARPWLSAWMDMRSRKIVGWIIRATDPNTDAVLESLRRGIQSHGVPVCAYTDNGKDFDATALTGETKKERRRRRADAKALSGNTGADRRYLEEAGEELTGNTKAAQRRRQLAVDTSQLGGIYTALGIKHMRALPYHGQSKPIERFFGTLEDRFGRMWETYCGRSPQHKPENLQEQMDRGNAPMLEEFVAAFDQWLEMAYHKKDHTGDSMNCKPHDAWEANLATKRTAPAELLEVMLQRRVGPRTVGQAGVCEGRIYYGEKVLSHLFGQDVYLRIDDRDVTKVSVWTADDKFIAVAPSNHKLPVRATSEHVREAIGEKRRAIKLLKGAKKARIDLQESIPEKVIRSAALLAQENASQTSPSNPPPSISPVRSDLESQLAALQSGFAVPLKKAVGDDTPSPGFSYSSATRQQDTPESGGFSGFVYHGRSSSVGDNNE